jgi:hypothetical protein
MYFNNNILLNPIQNTNATNGTAVKNIREYNYLWHIFTHEPSKYWHSLTPTFKIIVWIFKNWSISSYFRKYFNLAILSTSVIKFPNDAFEKCPAKPSAIQYMATRLTESTDLNHVDYPVQIKMYCDFLTETFNSVFKILAVLLYLD